MLFSNVESFSSTETLFHWTKIMWFLHLLPSSASHALTNDTVLFNLWPSKDSYGTAAFCNVMVWDFIGSISLPTPTTYLFRWYYYTTAAAAGHIQCKTAIISRIENRVANMDGIANCLRFKFSTHNIFFFVYFLYGRIVSNSVSCFRTTVIVFVRMYTRN